MNDNTQGLTSQDVTVRHHLVAASEATMPEDVLARLDSVIRHEASIRVQNAKAEEAKKCYVELAEKSSLGTFGANVPREYDRAGVGIELHDDTHHPHVSHTGRLA